MAAVAAERPADANNAETHPTTNTPAGVAAKLRTGTILRQEGSSDAIVHAAFCQCDASTGGANLFATVGGNKATVYDDRHFGRHLGLVMQYENVQTEYTKGGELDLCCWIPTPSSATDAPLGDHRLAVTGPKDKSIQVISLVETRVVSLLENTEKRVVHMQGINAAPDVLFACLSSGELKAYDINTESCIMQCPKAGVETFGVWAPLSEDGKLEHEPVMLVAPSKGGLFIWKLAESLPFVKGQSDKSGAVGSKRKQRTDEAANTSEEPKTFSDGLPAEHMTEVEFQSTDGAQIKSQAFSVVHPLNATSFLTLDDKGRKAIVWDWLLADENPSGSAYLSRVARMRYAPINASVPRISGGTDASTRWGYSTTSDGNLLCSAFNSTAYVHDLTTGERAMTLQHPTERLGKLPNCFVSLIADDARSVICSAGPGILFRHEAWD